MYLFDLSPEHFIPIMIFAIPIVAIVGGITAGIISTLGQQRLAELRHRERIAAIERGIDPERLPPPLIGSGAMFASPQEQARGLAQNLMIAGLVLVAVGSSLGVFLGSLDTGEPLWAIGLIPGSVGGALLLSSWLVRPRNGLPPSSS